MNVVGKQGQIIESTEPEAPAIEKRNLCSIIDGFAAHDKKTALTCFSKNSSSVVTYKMLSDEVKNMAAELRMLGAKKGDNFVFFATNSVNWVRSALAVIYSGATLVPIDPQQSDEVILHIVKDSMASWIFADDKGCKRIQKLLPGSAHRIIRLDDLAQGWRLSADQIRHAGPLLRLVKKDESYTVDGSDIAVLFYTSGTTGMPKGVPLSHTNMLLQLDAIAKTGLLIPGDRVLLPLPFFHVYPLNIGLFAPLSLGLAIVLPCAITGPEIMRSIEKGRVTVLFAVPRLLRSLYEAIAARLKSNRVAGSCFEMIMQSCQWLDLSFGLQPGKVLFAPLRHKFAPKLRLFTCGGAPVDSDLALKIRALGWQLAVGYGLTETSPLLTLRLPDDRDLEGVGSAISGVEIKIEAPKKQDEPIIGDAGEIWARGANVFSGYRNRPELNKASFSANGWFKTGDLGQFLNGHLHVLGRASSTIVMDGGEKIQPENVEDKIAMQPAISEIALLQVEHKLVALIVPDLKFINGSDAKSAVSEALKLGSRGLASYLQVTGFAITNEALPRTNLGKIKRFELKDRFEKALEHDKKTSRRLSVCDPAPIDSSDQILLVGNRKSADIVVTWSNEAVEASRGTEAGKTTTFANYNTETNWGKIHRAEMRLLTRLPEREFTDAEVRKAYLHEVGHAFGIAGHSSDKSDIMYFAVSSKQPGELSNRDIATIKYLYDHGPQLTLVGNVASSH